MHLLVTAHKIEDLEQTDCCPLCCVLGLPNLDAGAQPLVLSCASAMGGAWALGKLTRAIDPQKNRLQQTKLDALTSAAQ